MNTLKRFKAPFALVAALAIPAVTNGCGDDNPLCCTEFKAGAQINANIGGSAQAQVAVQAVADFAGIANAALSDLSAACRSMAEDLDTPPATLAEADARINAADADDQPKLRMQEYCKLAIAAITTVKGQAQATVKIVAQPPKCEASVSAKASCQGKCDVSGKCDIKANPPQCTGGKLEVACKGECTAKGSATVSCEGSCTGNCTGSCTAQGGVDCQGKCNGTCKGAAQGGTGEGITATGECKGKCEGTCEVTAPNAQCEGSCQGSCSASCQGSASASVKCDGECKGDFEPLKCEGGKLEGGCQVDAKCNASCDASVSAKAECTPPAITVEVTGNASGAASIAAIGKLKATFEKNFGIIFAFKSRLEGMFSLVGTITGSADAIVDIKAACIPQVAVVAGKAVGDVTAAVSTTGELAGSVQ